MQIFYNKKSDKLTIGLKETIVTHHEQVGTARLGLDANGECVMIEIRSASQHVDVPHHVDFELIDASTPPGGIIIIDRDDDAE